MANPRKFSEKIALHNQKQAEETAAFNQILQEVSHVIARGALTNLEEINAEGAAGGGIASADGSGSSPTGGAPSPGASRRDVASGRDGSQGRSSGAQGGQERGRSMGVGPMRGSRPGGGNRIDTSPYGSAAYLSPPPASDASSWRRTNSDSALHHSAMSGGGGGGQGGSNSGLDTLHLGQGSPRRAMDGQYLGGFGGSSGGVEGGGGPCDPGGGGRMLLSSALSSQLCDGGGRPRSCCDVPRVPGINIYPTSSQQEPGTLQIPSGNNTGSLPDLTNFHFPSPLPTPLDVEDHNSSSPYSSTSPQGGTSPTTLSPTSGGGLSSSPRQHQGARFSFGQPSSSPPSPIPVQQGGLSPGHSPTPNHRQPQQPPNMGSNLAHSPNHLSVPSLVSSSFLHSCKGLTFDNSSNMQMDSFQQNRYMYQQPHQPSNQQQHQLHHRQQQSQRSPPLLSNSQSIPTHLSSLSSYRSPHLNRPSPQSSPGLTVPSSPLGGYRSTSPVGRASPHSAPQSPVSPASSLGAGNQTPAALSNMSSHQHRHSTSSPSPSSPSPSPSSSSSASAITTNSSSASQEHQSNYYLVQNFEQFSMMDNPVSTSNDFIGSQSGSMHYSLTSPNMVGSPDDGGGGIDSVNLACLGLEMGLGLGCSSTMGGRVPHQDGTNNGMGQVADGGYYSHRQSPSSPSSMTMDPTRQSQQQQQQQQQHHQHHQQQQQHHHHHPHLQNQQHMQFGVRPLPSILSQPPPQPLDPIGGGGGGGGGGLNESGHHTAPQTPNSPTSIPDIILTDFSSGAGDDITATKDLSRVLAAGGAPGMIDEEDLSPYLFDADALRQDLGTLDSDGLQMLTAPDMNSITDPATEDHFRHDRL